MDYTGTATLHCTACGRDVAIETHASTPKSTPDGSLVVTVGLTADGASAVEYHETGRCQN